MAGHRPFLLLADALTRAGCAVLRTDDRGVTGWDHSRATYEDPTADVLAGAAHLASWPEIDPARIGLLGHSEAVPWPRRPRARRPGEVAFVVLGHRSG